METEGAVWVTALSNMSKLPNTVCNRFKQPLMEMEGGLLGNRLWKWKRTV
jgi:hypothetical protein